MGGRGEKAGNSLGEDRGFNRRLGQWVQDPARVQAQHGERWRSLRDRERGGERLGSRGGLVEQKGKPQGGLSSYFDTTSSTPRTTTAEQPSDQADRASPARKYPSTSAMTGFT